ncbi:MAG: nuclear transport factor 2 family protein [Parvibaculales bacterium]
MSDDATQICNLLYRCAELFDAGEFEAVLEMFQDGDFLLSEGRRLSPDNMREVWKGLVILHDGSPKTRHIVTNPEIVINGNEAVCRSCYMVLQATDTLPLQIIVSGRYVDRFVKSAEGLWQFSQRHYALMDLVGDVSQHIQADALAALQP